MVKKRKIGILLFIFGLMFFMSMPTMLQAGEAPLCQGGSNAYTHTFSETGGSLYVYFQYTWNSNCYVTGYSISETATPTGTWFVSSGPSHSVTVYTYEYDPSYTVTFTTHANIPPYHFLHSSVVITLNAPSAGSVTVTQNSDTITSS